MCLCVVCQSKHTTGAGFLTSPPAIWFCFSLSFLFIWDFAYIVSSFLSATQSVQGRERAMQAGFSCSSSPLTCVLYLPRNSVPLGVVWLRVKKIQLSPPPAFHSPYCRSNRFSFSESDCGWTHSIGLNVYGLHFPPPLQELKNNKK